MIDTDGMIKSQYDADKVADYGGGYTWLEEEENVSWDDAGFWKYTLYSPEGVKCVIIQSAIRTWKI